MKTMKTKRNTRRLKLIKRTRYAKRVRNIKKSFKLQSGGAFEMPEGSIHLANMSHEHISTELSPETRKIINTSNFKNIMKNKSKLDSSYKFVNPTLAEINERDAKIKTAEQKKTQIIENFNEYLRQTLKLPNDNIEKILLLANSVHPTQLNAFFDLFYNDIDYLNKTFDRYKKSYPNGKIEDYRNLYFNNLQNHFGLSTNLEFNNLHYKARKGLSDDVIAYVKKLKLKNSNISEKLTKIMNNPKLRNVFLTALYNDHNGNINNYALNSEFETDLDYLISNIN